MRETKGVRGEGQRKEAPGPAAQREELERRERKSERRAKCEVRE